MPDFQSTCERNLTHDAFHERRLTLAVLADEGHFLSTLDGKGDMVEDRVVAIVLAHIVANHRIITAAKARRELQMHLLVVHLVHFDGYDFLQLFDAALHLHSLGWLVAEPLYKILDVSDFLLLVLVSPQLLLTTFLTKHDVLVILHLIVLHPSASDFQRTVGHIIYKGTVVADQDHRLGTLS